MGLVAPRHLRIVGSSQTRDRTHVPCIGRRILNHWATREVPFPPFLKDEICSLLFKSRLYIDSNSFNFLEDPAPLVMPPSLLHLPPLLLISFLQSVYSLKFPFSVVERLL